MQTYRRPKALPSISPELPTPCGNIYVTVSFSKETGLPTEVFCRLEKNSGCGAAVTSGLTITLSKALQQGCDARILAKGLMGNRCHRSWAWDKGKPIYSCVDAIGKAILEAMEIAESQSEETDHPTPAVA